MATLASIAKELGLSKMTVSRAFDPRFADLVKPETKKRIFEFCRKQDYHPSLIGRSFSTGKTFKLGVISAADRKITLFSTLFFSGITEAALERNYTLVMMFIERPKSCIDLVNCSVADAYIVNTTNWNEPLLELFRQKHIPVIIHDLIRSRELNLPVLYRDISPAYRQFWQNLKREDRNRTAFVGRGLVTGKWNDLLKSAPRGVTVDRIMISDEEENVLLHRDSAREFAERTLDRLLKYRMLWCSSDLVALGICDTMKKHGIEPGRDIYIVGFDNLEGTMGEFPECGLTTIDPGWKECGRKMAGMALASLDSGRDLPEQTPWFAEAVYRRTFAKNESNN